MGMIFAPGVQASFLDFSSPGRASAMGGNMVASPLGTSALYFNPAGLAFDSQFEASARYESLFAGIEGDNLSTGDLSFLAPFKTAGAFGLSWDHFGANLLQQDRFQLSWGRNLGSEGFLEGTGVGLSLSYLRQAFTYSAPTVGISLTNVSSSAFSLGAGVLCDLDPSFTLGFSADDINQPNLGVVGTDLLPVELRGGAALRWPMADWSRMVLTVGESLTGGTWDTQGGLEWIMTRWGLSLRGGANSTEGGVGFGWTGSGLTLDYAYRFSIGNQASLAGTGVPGSHLLELSFNWGEEKKPAESFEKYILKAREESVAGHWTQAFWYYRYALQVKPNDPTALKEKAYALAQYNRQRANKYFKEGQEAEAQGYLLEERRDYDWACQLDPDNSQYKEAKQRSLAVNASALADPKVQKAVDEATRAARAGHKKEALDRILNVLPLYPDDPSLNVLVQSFRAKPVTVTMVPKTDPEVKRLLKEADLYLEKGRADLATADWKKVLRIDPAQSQAQASLRERAQGEEVSDLSKEDRAKVQDLYQKGLNAYLQGDIGEAIADWEKVLKLDPHHVNAQNNLVRAKLEMSQEKP
jgi:tetratricopeptide (TPR) repeat protein